MKKINFNDKTTGELKALVSEARKSLVDLRVQKEQRKLKNLHTIGVKRREIARLLTAQRKKELAS